MIGTTCLVSYFPGKRYTFIHVVLPLFLCVLTTPFPTQLLGAQEGTILCKELLKDWNTSHNTKNQSAFKRLFDTNVFFYGENLSGEQCSQLKGKMLSKYPDFSQVIQQIRLCESSDQTEICFSFTKRVRTNGKWKEYPSYLTFSLTPDGWKISVEGDDITDRNLAKLYNQGKPRQQRTISGDYNGDGIRESMWLQAPTLTDAGDDCEGECTSFIVFSDTRIRPIKVENCLGGQPRNLGDLNDDGTDEVGLLPLWFTSCWRDYSVWTYRNNGWIYPLDGISTHCNQWSDSQFPIKKHPLKDGFVITKFSDFVGDDIVIKQKVLQIE